MLVAMAHHLFVLVVALLSLAGRGRPDLAADKAECADKLVGLATCLPYVEGQAKSPTPDCCTGYKQATAKNIKCLCILIKDRDDPGLGLSMNVNVAITLPAKCDAPTNLSTCTKLLNLPPTSKEAKEFQHFENVLEGKESGAAKGTPSGTGTGTTPGSNDVKANSTATGAGAIGAHASDCSRERLMSTKVLAFCLLGFLLTIFRN